jgi:hypothetical protein
VLVVLGRAFALPPQAASPLIMSTTRRVSTASRFVFLTRVFIGFSVLSAIGLKAEISSWGSLHYALSHMQSVCESAQVVSAWCLALSITCPVLQPYVVYGKDSFLGQPFAPQKEQILLMLSAYAIAC